MNRWWLIPILCLALGCEKNPIERLTDPVPAGQVSQHSPQMVIFDHELKTGGGLALIPAGNDQSIDVENRDEPRKSFAQIRYVWNGRDVAGQHLFAGFQLIVTPNSSTLLAAPAKNLSAPGYSKLRLFIRGTLADDTDVKIEGPSDGITGSTSSRTLTKAQLTNSWQEVVVPVNPSEFGSVRVFMTLTLQYSQPPRTTEAGTGGTIYVDGIVYE